MSDTMGDAKNIKLEAVRILSNPEGHGGIWPDNELIVLIDLAANYNCVATLVLQAYATKEAVARNGGA